MKTLNVLTPKVDAHCQSCGFPVVFNQEDKKQIILEETYQFTCPQCQEISKIKIDLYLSKLVFIHPDKN